MTRKALIFAMVVFTIHAVRSQPDDDGRETRKTKGKIQFTCQPMPFLWGDNTQDFRLECVAELPPGKAGVATFEWQDSLGTDTRIRSTILGVAALNGTIGEGEERVSVHTTFLRDDAPVPTCQNKGKVVLTFNRTVPIVIELKKGVEDGDDGKVHDKPKKHKHDHEHDSYDKDHEYYGPKDHEYNSYDEDHYDSPFGKGHDYDSYTSDAYKVELQSKFDEWEDSEDDVDAEVAAWGDHSKECPHKVNDPDKVDSSRAKKSNDHKYSHSDKSYEGKDYKEANVSVSAEPAQTANRKRATPGGLRAVVKCKSAPDQAPANGNCIVLLRLRVLFNGGFSAIDGINRAARQAAALVETQGYTCRPITYLDADNNLDTLELNGGAGPTVTTQACFPPFGGAGGRRLTQAETSQAEPAQSGAATIAAGALWDDVHYARATRAARYQVGIHGCLPDVQFLPAPPAFDRLSTTPRTFEMVSSWGGPADPAFPSGRNPVCNSCFKDGVNYGPGLGGPPVGWETPPFSLRNTAVRGRATYRDAAMVLTDTVIAPEGPSIIVLFRSTISNLEFSQWITNLGTCLLRATNTDPISPTNAAAGRVCDGWREIVELLNQGFQGTGLLGVPRTTLNGPATGLMQEVKNRIDALKPAGPASPSTQTRIFVFGHSRGGALAAVFAAMLLAEQQAGRLGTYTGPFGARGQVSLYTMGAPSVGDATFAKYLEDRMFERFRIIDRYDPVVTMPTQTISSYFHWRPSVWFRDATPNILPSPRSFCVVTPQAQLSANLQTCFISCNDALVCPNNSPVGAAAAVAGTPVPASQACTDATEFFQRNVFLGAFAGRVRDHATYMGMDQDNVDSPFYCRLDASVFAGGCVGCSTPPTTCPAFTREVPGVTLVG